MKEKEKILVKNYLNHKLSPSPLLWSLLALSLCLIMSKLYWDYPISEYLSANPKLVFEQKEYWRLFTTSFVHGDLSHFLSNSIMLTIMGYFVSYHYGAVMYPIGGFIAGILINYLVLLTHAPEVGLVGASGIVHYLWGFWLVLYIFIQRQIPLHRRFMKATAVGIFILIPTEFKPQVSYLAHGIGLILGLVSGLIYFLLNYKSIRSHEIWEEIIEEEDQDDELDPQLDYFYNTTLH